MNDYDDPTFDSMSEDDAPDRHRTTMAKSLDPDTILDTLVPATVDWRGTVSRHPMVSVASVGLVGYLVGRTKGASILTGLTAALSAAMMRQLSDVFEGDFFDF